jgi:DNA mismatch repair protein MutH
MLELVAADKLVLEQLLGAVQHGQESIGSHGVRLHGIPAAVDTKPLDMTLVRLSDRILLAVGKDASHVGSNTRQAVLFEEVFGQSRPRRWMRWKISMLTKPNVRNQSFPTQRQLPESWRCDIASHPRPKQDAGGGVEVEGSLTSSTKKVFWANIQM